MKKNCNTITGIFVGFFWAWSVSAQTTDKLTIDPDTPWCPKEIGVQRSDDEAVPHGAILRVGDKRFRVCRWDVPAPLISRSMRFFFNPERVIGLHSSRSMVGLVVMMRPWERENGSYSAYSLSFGNRTLGELTYEEYGLPDPPTEKAADIRIFRNPTISENTPDHLIRCNRDPEIDQVATCLIFLEYQGITAYLMFINGGPQLKPMPVDDFANHIRDVVNILSTADVTDFDPADWPPIPVEP